MASSLYPSSLSLLSLSSPSRNIIPSPPSINPLYSNRRHPPPLSATKKRKRPKGSFPFNKADILDYDSTQTKRESKEPEDDEDDRDAAIPEVVTNRMMRRVGFSVGIPLALGLSFFPFFYYLKKGLKIDVPTWIPFGVSFIFFGGALLGVSYGIVSASWDPLREGSLLGWNEARRNWPVFWESLRGKKD